MSFHFYEHNFYVYFPLQIRKHSNPINWLVQHERSEAQFQFLTFIAWLFILVKKRILKSTALLGDCTKEKEVNKNNTGCLSYCLRPGLQNVASSGADL